MGRADNARVAEALGRAKGRGVWRRAQCVFCIDAGDRDRKLSLGINTVSGRWHCFKCGRWGRLDGHEATETFTIEDDVKEIVEIPLPDEYEPLWEGTGSRANVFAPARDYLLKTRKLSPEVIEEYQIGACAEGFYEGRVIVPVRYGNALAGFVARTWAKVSKDAQGTDGLPYLYPEGMSRGLFFFNQAILQTVTNEPVLVTEGVFDALPHCRQALACFGKPTSDQLDILRTIARPIVFALDADAWEESAMLALAFRFDGHQAGFVKFDPAEKDPGNVAPDILRRRAKKALRSEVVL